MSITEEMYRNFPTKDWYQLLRRKEAYSYYTDLPFERLVKDLKGEIEELFQGIEANDTENIKEEVADVIFNTQQLIQALFKKWLLNWEDLKNTWKEQKKKIYRRQPFLKDNSEKPTDREHETALFKKLKEQRKAAQAKPKEIQTEILFD